jgi:hypothetical protein
MFVFALVPASVRLSSPSADVVTVVFVMFVFALVPASVRLSSPSADVVTVVCVMFVFTLVPITSTVVFSVGSHNEAWTDSTEVAAVVVEADGSGSVKKQQQQQNKKTNKRGYVVAERFTARLTCLDSQACNQYLCGVWVRSQLAALDMLHWIKRDFRRGSRTGGFLRALQFPPPSKGSYIPNVLGRRDTVAVLSPGKVARFFQGNL